MEIYFGGPYHPKKSGIDWYDKERYLRYSIKEYLGTGGGLIAEHPEQTRVDYDLDNRMPVSTQ